MYSARDERDGRLVAIKMLHRVTGATIYRFKREFRAVAEQHHPNLLQLYELFSVGDHWFFSMELVEGLRLDHWILGERPSAAVQETLPDTPSQLPLATPNEAPPDLERLRPAIAQLAAAIAHLHSLGVVHRDLKPANVIVTREGRTVLLDFGLIAEADPGEQQSTLGVVMGTPAYMAPEQALGQITTPAADWYAFGALLFELLHGRPPFSGSSHDILTAKMAPRTWRLPERSDAPADLAALARALLAPEPKDRPTAAAVMAAVAAAPFVPQPTPSSDVPFVGRARELRGLQEAFSLTEQGRAVIATVHGQSGVGKTALLREFTARLGSDVVVLSGRCLEREQVPYKALDGAVDSLTRYLSQQSVQDVSGLMPRDTQALCRVFPVFSRLRLLSEQPSRARSWTPHEERRRGFAALRESLGRLADRRPLVVTIDDLQWGDEDSIEPLVGLLAPPDPPPLLLILAYRSEDEHKSPVLRALHESALIKDGTTRDVVLAPLTDGEAQELAMRLLPRDQQHRASLVARESGGLPYFLPELVRVLDDVGSDEVAHVSLESLVRRRVDRLSPQARKLLEVVAVAGHPVRRMHASHAAELDSVSDEAVDELVREHFLRSVRSADALLETFHDRVREGVVSSLAEPEQREIHARLARLLAAEPDAVDPELLATHWRLAGELELARPVSIEAAERATHAFAFERAITLFTGALEGASPQQQREIKARLADVLSYAGRNSQAARAYLEAVDGAAPAEARDRKRRATELMARAGRPAEAAALARELLPEVGLVWAETRGQTLRSVIKNKLRLKLKGYRYKERPLTAADADEIMRVDLCWTLGSAFSPIDILRGTDYQAQHMVRALALGDPLRVARGFALEAVLLAVEGGSSTLKAELLARRAAELAARLDHAYAIGWAFLAEAVCDSMQGRFRRARERIDDAFAIMRAREPEGFWQIAITEIWFKVRSCFYLGDFATLATEGARVTREAEDRGDLLTLISARATCLVRVLLIQGNPAAARELCVRSNAAWTKDDGWHVQHQESVRGEIECDLYEGNGARALARIRETWPALRASLLVRAEIERVLNFSLFAVAALHARELREAQRWTKELSRQTFPWARALAAAMRAGVLALRSDDRAPAAYAHAANQFDALEMKAYAAVARRRRGEVLGGDAGAAEVAREEAVLRALGVREPASFARTLVG
ncbi:MAG: protein kinase [Deltaproteobacteria bacterium]|nr:protein kinase [Deltaproteobacteria bacterium]